MGLTVDVQVGGEPRDPGLVRERSVRREIGPGEHVVRMGALSHPPDRAARETRANFRDRPQGLCGHELDLGRAVDVDELDHQVADPVIFKSPLEIDKLGIDCGHALIDPPGLRLAIRGLTPASRLSSKPKHNC